MPSGRTETPEPASASRGERPGRRRRVNSSFRGFFSRSDSQTSSREDASPSSSSPTDESIPLTFEALRAARRASARAKRPAHPIPTPPPPGPAERARQAAESLLRASLLGEPGPYHSRDDEWDDGRFMDVSSNGSGPTSVPAPPDEEPPPPSPPEYPAPPRRPVSAAERERARVEAARRALLFNFRAATPPPPADAPGPGSAASASELEEEVTPEQLRAEAAARARLLGSPRRAHWHAQEAAREAGLAQRARLLGPAGTELAREVGSLRAARADAERAWAAALDGIEQRMAAAEAEVHHTCSEGPECVIDLTRIVKGDLVVRLPCMHVFHVECIMDYLRNDPAPVCPIDRSPVPSTDVNRLPVWRWEEDT